MQFADNIDNKEIIDLLNKCWMTHDGMWFFHCLQQFGIEETNKLNKLAIKSLAPIEMGRIRNLLGYRQNIDNYTELSDFFKKAAELMIPEFMYAAFRFPKENIMEWAFKPGKCFAYKGINRLGVIDNYECGVLYRIRCWLDCLGIKNTFSPEINGCRMHLEGKCEGQIHLF